jgi:hypothetical protein
VPLRDLRARKIDHVAKQAADRGTHHVQDFETAGHGIYALLTIGAGKWVPSTSAEHVRAYTQRHHVFKRLCR